MGKLKFNIQGFSAQKRATVVSTGVAGILTVIKLIVGIASSSVAVLASAIDSILDMGVSLFNFFAIKKAEEHPSKDFPYGKGKIQAIAGVIEGTIITLSGLYIIYEAIIKIVAQKSTHHLESSLMVMIFSIIVTWFLVKYLLRVAEETENIVIKSDALHYQTDLLSNGAVLLSLGLVYITNFDWIDALFGFAIGVYIIYSAYEIIHEGIMVLLDRALDSETVAKIAEIIANHPKVKGYHYLKTRSDGSVNFAEFHLVLTPEMRLDEAHKIAEDIEYQIALLDKKKGWLITPHFDPYDDEDINEIYLTGKVAEGDKSEK